MDVQTKVKTYFSEIKEDINFIKDNKDEEKEIRKARISSVALRALGGLVAVMTISPALSTIVAFVLSPLTILGSLAATVMGVIISRDLFKMGKNIRELLAHYDGLKGHWAQFIGATVGLVKTALHEKWHDMPYYYKDTILLQRLYRWTHKASSPAPSA